MIKNFLSMHMPFLDLEYFYFRNDIFDIHGLFLWWIFIKRVRIVSILEILRHMRQDKDVPQEK